MKNCLLLVLLCAGFWCAGCQSHPRHPSRPVVLLNLLNQLAVVDIAHEKNGDPPPRGFATWPAYWQNHFLAVQMTPASSAVNSGSLRQIVNAHRAFVNVRRAQAALPPLDPNARAPVPVQRLAAPPPIGTPGPDL